MSNTSPGRQNFASGSPRRPGTPSGARAVRDIHVADTQLKNVSYDHNPSQRDPDFKWISEFTKLWSLDWNVGFATRSLFRNKFYFPSDPFKQFLHIIRGKELMNEIPETVNYDDYSVICINEAQFFTGLTTFCKKALACKKTLYVCGLDGDFKQEPFGEILNLIPLCNNITRLHAFCAICKDCTPAFFTKRHHESKEQKLIGSVEHIAVCREHLYS